MTTDLNKYRDELIEYINDDILDLLDEFSAGRIADEVISIGNRLLHRNECAGHIIENGWDYLYKVHNTQPNGYVSVSSAAGHTGVSRTIYYPFYEDEEEGYLPALCNLAGMLNEAWYYCNE